jgi:uncharacterized membrane protein YfcA
MTAILIFTLVFLAALIQSISGFGFAVIIMPLITLVLGLQAAAPMVALTALTVYVINLIRYRQAINLGEVLRLGVMSALGVPIGIWALGSVSETLVKQVMGLVLIAYAIYTLARPATSWVPSHFWVYPAGFLAGCMGGAYNTPGPPLIVYGSLRQWPKDEFRAVLQALFLASAVLVVTSHLVAGHVTEDVLASYLYALPALGLGIFVGSRLDNKVDRERFRILVTALILILGLSLVIGI